MKIAPALLQRFKTSLARQANQAQDQEAFFERILANLAGRKVLCFGAVPFLYNLDGPGRGARPAGPVRARKALSPAAAA